MAVQREEALEHCFILFTLIILKFNIYMSWILSFWQAGLGKQWWIASFGCITVWLNHIVQILGWLQDLWGCQNISDVYGKHWKYEPPHDKTNKMICAPSEDSEQPGHPPSLIRVIAVRMKKHCILSYPSSALGRLWSDWADAQADLSLHWAHRSFCWFCREAA